MARPAVARLHFTDEEALAAVSKVMSNEPLSDRDREVVRVGMETLLHINQRLRQGALSVRKLKAILGIRPDRAKSKDKDKAENEDKDKDKDNEMAQGNGCPESSNDSNATAGSGEDNDPQTLGQPDNQQPSATSIGPSASVQPDGQIDPANPQPPKNRDEHGRRGWNDFPDAPICYHYHPRLHRGCECPACLRGRLYPGEPARFACIQGQANLVVKRHEIERLVCNLCKTAFTAPLEQELQEDGVSGSRLYAFSAATMVVLLKQFGGMPWHRQEDLQQGIGVRVPDASMADLTERVANAARPVADYLHALARDAFKFFADDTGAMILEQRSITCTQRSTGKQVERTGCHVTCVVAVTSDGHWITLYRVGIQHSGELLDQVLTGRDKTLPPPLVMGDCSACNKVTVCLVIYGGCNAHAVRRFKAAKDRDPENAGYALERYKQIFDNETYCKEQGFDDQQRLAYHREHSKPLFDEICEHGEALFEAKAIEPSSDIGKAYSYMTGNRVRLSAFTRIPGMPLENNLVERKLRRPVRLRDNVPFFKNAVGARHADIIWTVGDTALDYDVNLSEYFSALQCYAPDVRQNPHLWMPWLYTQRLEALRQEAFEPAAAACGDGLTGSGQPEGIDVSGCPPEQPASTATAVNPPDASCLQRRCASNPRRPKEHVADADPRRTPRRPGRSAKTENAPSTSASS